MVALAVQNWLLETYEKYIIVMVFHTWVCFSARGVQWAYTSSVDCKNQWLAQEFIVYLSDNTDCREIAIFYLDEHEIKHKNPYFLCNVMKPYSVLTGPQPSH